MLERFNIRGVLGIIIVIGGLVLISFANLTDIQFNAISNFIMLVLGYYFVSSERNKKLNNDNNSGSN